MSNAGRNANKARLRRLRRIADPVRWMLYTARARAKRKGLAFSIERKHIHIPTHCPVLGIKLDSSPDLKRHDSRPSLDRRDSKKGYVPGNVLVISWRANRIKCDATPEELERIAKFYGKARR